MPYDSYTLGTISTLVFAHTPARMPEVCGITVTFRGTGRSTCLPWPRITPRNGSVLRLFLAYRAASYLDLKEPEPAAAAATQSLLLALRTGAPRCVRLIKDLLPPRFQPYAHAQGVAELLQLAPA
ncbi:hypothetical protein [Streptomyces azureus]|uniref:Tetratricopeptide repeat protein n=1 Tax=Streptomyces azureus TaxID=146537 RepID=A0A0K8PX34_STRAJ|nr:hypothetical protein [Streptomyces azureus]GAP52371.1 tetratricopeptide repeat protein [Streptomyces azureus]